MNEIPNPLEKEIDEFDNFMIKVTEVKKLMEGLTSKNKTVVDEALKGVESFLGKPDKFLNNIDKDSLTVKSCKTVINQKAFDNMGKESNQQQTETPEAFMKSCEEDAKRRTEERRMQKESSDTFKIQAIAAFNKGEFEKALCFYNKAVDAYRGSSHLYQSRALTCLKLKLYQRTVEDCDLVLRCFNSKSLKALLYKGKAHKALGEEDQANECVQEAIANHPKSEDDIHQYMSDEAEVEK